MSEQTIEQCLFDITNPGEEYFNFTGFNGHIPFLGMAEIWFDCHYCGNATAYRPSQCKKCNSISFEQQLSKGRRFKILSGAA